MATNLTTSLNIDGTTYDLGDAETRAEVATLKSQTAISITRANQPSGTADYSSAYKMATLVVVSVNGSITGGTAISSPIITGLPAAKASAYALLRNQSTGAVYGMQIGTGATQLTISNTLPSGNAAYIGQIIYVPT